jgi:hypothetical protein
MSDDGDVSNRTILREVIVFAAIVLVAGAIFVAFRVAKNGTRVLTVSPHASQPQTEPPPR